MVEFKVGDLLEFYPDDLHISVLVVMVSEEGVRYIDPNNLIFNDDSSVLTQYVSNATLLEWINYADPVTESMVSFVERMVGGRQ